MRNFLYILSIAFLGLVSCTNNEDEPIVPPDPPKPPTSVSAKDIVGSWETYYYTKQVIANPDDPKNQVIYNGLRFTDHDGFKTIFYEENTEYKFKSLNAAGGIIENGTYYVSNDTIFFDWKTPRGNDTITNQRLIEFEANKGTMKVNKTYKDPLSKYKVIDTKVQRNIAIAPNYSEAGLPKTKIDYAELSDGKWEIYDCLALSGTQKDKDKTDKMLKQLKGTKYKFYTDAQGNKKCLIYQYKPSSDSWGEEDYPILKLDDVIHFLYSIKNEETGELEPASFFIWITNRKEREIDNAKYDSFVDKFEERDSKDISIIKLNEIYIRKISD